MLLSPPPDRLRPGRATIAVGLAVSGLVLLGTGLGTSATPDPARAAPPPASTPSASSSAAAPTATAPGRPSAPAGGADVRDAGSGLVLPESDPLVLSVPAIDVRSRLVELGLQADRTMEVPEDPDVAGWFTRGASPGALGPAVIGGHVTWDGAPGVFYRLGTLRRGDRVTVSRSDGRTAVFSVTRVDRYDKARFPTGAVYGAIDHAGLRLITCGGSYDTSRHRYLDNVVVFARLVAVRQARD